MLNVPEKFTIESCAANSANLLWAGLNGIFVYLAISLIIFLSKFLKDIPKKCHYMKYDCEIYILGVSFLLLVYIIII